MAHNLSYNKRTGKFSFFSVKDKAWHGLGVIIQDHPTSAEAIQYAGLDYIVEKRQLFTFDTENQNGSNKLSLTKANILVPSYFATVRTDTDVVLGVVGKDYKVVQNKRAFAFFDSIVGKDGIRYETAGALGNGERIFITAKLPKYIRVGNKDSLEQYLFLTTSHDGFGSITAAFTPVRIVCNNTLNAAIKSSSNIVKIRHTERAKERLEQAHHLLGISDRLSEELEVIFNHWAKVRITDTEVRKLIQAAMAPSKEVFHNNIGKDDEPSSSFKSIVDSIYEYAMSSSAQQMETTAGTVFGAYNAVTGYFQNVRTYRNQEAKVKSLFFGGIAQQRTQTAFDLCTLFSKHGSDGLQLN
jgi:phage/plasmid-like protein (TIGR03299 family)